MNKDSTPRDTQPNFGSGSTRPTPQAYQAGGTSPQGAHTETPAARTEAASSNSAKAQEKQARAEAKAQAKADKKAAKQAASKTPSPNNGNNNGKPKNKRTTRLIIIGAILLILAIILAVFAFCSDGWRDSAAQSGSLQGLTKEQIIEELNKQAEEGMMNITMSGSIEFENGSAEGAARIQNLPSNRLDQKVTITLDATGETLYESGAIEPGQYIEFIRLDKNLEAGTYAATAMFDGYESGTRDKVGTAGLKIEIIVLN